MSVPLKVISMSAICTATASAANFGGAKTCIKYPETCTVSPLQAAISDLIKAQNAHKAWAFVANLFALKERASKHRLANTASYTIEELQLLIQGEDGQPFLEALMADAQPQWWMHLRKSLRLSAARRKQAEAQQEVLAIETAPMERSARRQMKRFADADRRLNTDLAAKELAVGLLFPHGSRAEAGALAQAERPAIRHGGARR